MDDITEKQKILDNLLDSNKDIEKIFNILAEQTKKDSDNSITVSIATQLFDIVADNIELAPIVAQKLQRKDMTIQKCAEAMKDYARTIHVMKNIDSVRITNEEADRIIRKFYGLPLQTD